MADVNPYWYHKTVSRMREFFVGKGFMESHTQSYPSLLALCNDPSSLVSYTCGDEEWLLPQTSQTRLEYNLLQNPEIPGFFCISTSYRYEQNPIPERHENIFPVFEFETKGGIDVLQELKVELLEYLGFGGQDSFGHARYEDILKQFRVCDLDVATENLIGKELNKVFMIDSFSKLAAPSWNMKDDSTHSYYNKLDVILYGVSTMAGAERSCDKDQMRHNFHHMKDGTHSQALFDRFGVDRVEKELEDFLSMSLFPRCGGSIGIDRLIRAMKMLESDSRNISSDNVIDIAKPIEIMVKSV